MTPSLEQWRRSKEVSQEEVGKAIGVTGGFIGQLERGEKTPSFTKATALAEYYGVSLDDLRAALRAAKRATEQVQA